MSELAGIDAVSVDQDELEQDLAVKASEALRDRDNELDQKRLDKTRDKLSKLNGQIALLSDKANDPSVKLSLREKYKDDIFKIQRNDLRQLKQDEQDILDRMSGRNTQSTDSAQVSGRRADETEHEYLVRTGKITPFAETTAVDDDETEDERSHQDLARPSALLERSRKRQKVSQDDDEEFKPNDQDSADENEFHSDSTIDETDKPEVDDGDQQIWKRRKSKWEALRARLRKEPVEDEEHAPHPEYKDMKLGDGFSIPGDVWRSLFPHQKTGVRWLYELYKQKVGGIIADEMGLGKTVQVAAFLAGMAYSHKMKRPVLIVAPATVLHQWVAEIHQWWPPLRVAILHSIGTAMGKADVELRDDEEPEEILGSRDAAKRLIASISETGGVVVTTYAGLKIYSKLLLPKLWSYCVLDEGHKIRNPNSDISLVCKQVKTVNRIILSGTPIQNNLTELWSLFDFVFPGKLGTLPVFQNQFAVPINVGGYANATNIQVQTAYKCAVILRDIISPYLLRRMKSDVATGLPNKTEKVLFCKLTKPQEIAYTHFLESDEMKSILDGKRQVLYGVDILRKICNHPDLVSREINQATLVDYGNPERSGKMQVVQGLLQLWNQDHKTLLFTQGRQMLDILEKFVRNLGIDYLRMDGTTPIQQRQSLVDKFNNNPVYKVFLLTTKVGGLGVNLTGADRVIIFDPDWNPSTDIQARERSWRLGQKREVFIYRLMIAGAIEEKIYHRQIFKQFLTNKILQDPKQKRFFKNTDLHDLFSLGESASGALFGQSKKPEDTNAGKDGIKGVEKTDDYDTGEGEKKKDDDGLLETLFSNANVHSTLEHDAVMEASRPDTVLMEREATRIAQQAAEALRESRKLARKAKVGTPTWTGRFGKAGKSSSASILGNLKEKRDLETSSTANIKIAEVQPYKDKLELVVKYLNGLPSKQSKSADIVRACNIVLDDDQAVANLRRMLQSVALWDKNEKVWKLKEDFT